MKLKLRRLREKKDKNRAAKGVFKKYGGAIYQASMIYKRKGEEFFADMIFPIRIRYWRGNWVYGVLNLRPKSKKRGGKNR